MSLDLIGQILAQNQAIQQLTASQGPWVLLARYSQLKALVRRLERGASCPKSASLAFTFLTDGHQTHLQTLARLGYGDGRRPVYHLAYQLAFERLQYQSQLATSVLA